MCWYFFFRIVFRIDAADGKSCHPEFIKTDGHSIANFKEVNYIGLIRRITVCSTLRIAQLPKGVSFKVSGPRGSPGTKVLFDIYNDVIALTSLKRLV